MGFSPFSGAERAWVEDPIVNFAVQQGADPDHARAGAQASLLGAGLLTGGMQAFGKWDDLADLGQKLYPGAAAAVKRMGGVWGGESADNLPSEVPQKFPKDFQKAKPGRGTIAQDEFWKEKGWTKGPDDKWRFEISDRYATVKPVSFSPGGDEYKLGEVLYHPDLYKHYPELKEMKVNLRQQESWGENTWQGVYHQYEEGKAPSIEIKFGGEGEGLKTALVHEVQHTIQQIENFYQGGSPGDMPRVRNKFKSKLADYKREKQSLLKAREEGFEFGGYTIKRLDEEIEDIEFVLKEGFGEGKGKYMPNIEMYRRLYGEIEARNAQHRMEWTDSERRQLPPATTESRNRRQFIPSVFGRVGREGFVRSVGKTDVVKE